LNRGREGGRRDCHVETESVGHFNLVLRNRFDILGETGKVEIVEMLPSMNRGDGNLNLEIVSNKKSYSSTNNKKVKVSNAGKLVGSWLFIKRAW
jgi:hypothetical protein